MEISIFGILGLVVALLIKKSGTVAALVRGVKAWVLGVLGGAAL